MPDVPRPADHPSPLHRYHEYSRFLEYDPFDAASFQRCAARLNSPAGPREVLALAEIAAAEVDTAAPRAEATARRLGEPRTLVVLTLLQRGIGFGRLADLYQFLTTARLARELSGLLARPVVPVAWYTGPEPAAEVGEAMTVLSGGNLLSFEPAAWRRYLREVMPREVAVAADPVDLDLRITAGLLTRPAPVLIRPGAGELRRRVGRILAELLVREAGIRVEWELLRRQNRSGGNPLFLPVPEREHSLLLDGTGAPSVDGRELGRRLSRGDASLRPGPAVAALPALLLLPVVAVVLGAGDFPYWPLQALALRVMGVEPPVAYPAEEFTLLPENLAARMEEEGLKLPPLLADPAETVRRHLAARAPLDLGALRREVEGRLDEVERLLTAGLNPLPGAEGPLQAFLTREAEGLRQLFARAAELLAAEQESLRRELEELAALLRPYGLPQSTVLAALPFALAGGSELWRGVPLDPQPRLLRCPPLRAVPGPAAIDRREARSV